MACIKTNSNSITNIFTIALNQDSDFRQEMLELFAKKIKRKIDDTVEFYNCTYSPLLYEEMNGKEIDIVARIPGKHKPVMMIEVKAGVREPLQESQNMKGEYQKTAKKHNIPLVYIIPENYTHKDKLPAEATKITWETIYKISKNGISLPIKQFVEMSEENEEIRDEERKLFENKELLLKIYRLKEDILEQIENVLLNKKRIEASSHREENQWAVGYYYQTKRPRADYFVGFNLYYSDIENGKYFLALDIQENCKNTDLGDRQVNPLYFNEGYYFLPILVEGILDGDKSVLSEIRKRIRKELKIKEIDKDIRENFVHFYSLRSKIGDDKFDDLFNSGELNNKVYEAIKKKYLKIVSSVLQNVVFY